MRSLPVLPNFRRCLSLRAAAFVWVLAWTGLLSAAVHAQTIYSCVDASGKRLTSDRPIPECHTRDQRVHNADGSVKSVLPPALSPDERAELEARERQAAAERMAQQEALRRDRNLLRRYPSEAPHKKAREAALDDVRKSVARSQQRLADLSVERKPLMDEAEFYKGRTLPAKLRQQMDANDAAVDAQRNLVQNTQEEVVRINALYDVELSRLKRLWAGAVPGSLGPIVAPKSPAAQLAAPSSNAPTVDAPASKAPSAKPAIVTTLPASSSTPR